MNLTKNLTFNQIISAVSIDSQYKKAITSAEKLYLIKPLGLQTLDPTLVVQLLNRNTEKSKTIISTVSDRSQAFYELTWALNEYKIFVWISVCYAYTKRKEFQQNDNEDFAALQQIFPRKSLQFIEYHLKSLVKEFKNVLEKWTEKEEQLLADIVKQQDRGNYKWSEISYKLFEFSEKKFFRTPYKCREKWFNYLAPQVNRSKWTDLQDLQLINSTIKYGTKWALISKLFNGTRTEHMIKNRYNSLVKLYQCKSQRTSKKKLEDKIFNAITNKIAQNSTKKDVDEEMMAQQSIEYSETKERKENRHVKQITKKEDKGVNTLDFEEIMLNQSIEASNEVKHIQMQMFLPSFLPQEFQIFV